MPTSANVTTGKPKITGAVFIAPVGTALPTDATTALATDFAEIGYISDDGVKNSTDIDSDSIKAWGGTKVLELQNSKDDSFEMTMIEAMNANVLKAVYGSSNVTGTSAASGISVKVGSSEPEAFSWVIDIAYRNNVLKRIVIPCARISKLGDITYSDSDAVGYDATLALTADDAGVYHYEYIVKKTK